MFAQAPDGSEIAYGTVEAIKLIPVKKAEGYLGRSADTVAGATENEVASHFGILGSIAELAVSGVHSYEEIKHTKLTTPYLTVDVKGRTVRYPVIPSLYPKGHVPHGFTVGERVKLVYRKAWKAMRIYPVTAPTGS
jgi:hypothetical protein